MNQLVFIRRTVYALKRNYGVPLELYTTVSSTVDLESGQKVVERTVHRIKRAILLPKRLTRDFVYDLSFIAANKNFTYGGTFDKNQRTVIIDTKDYPKDYQVKLGDYAMMNHVRFNIKEATEFDHRLAILLTVEEIKGERPFAITEKVVRHTLLMSHSVIGNKETSQSANNDISLTQEAVGVL